MILYDVEDLQESSRQQSRIIEQRQILSKIKSLNILIQNLMQKKLRIDLELKRTKIKISNLRKMTSTTLKSSLQLESDIDVTITRSDAKNLCEQNGLEYETISELIEALTESQKLESEFETLFAPFITEIES